MPESEFYAGMEEYLRRVHAGGWSPDSIPGRNAQEEFTRWLSGIMAQTWEEGKNLGYAYGRQDEKLGYRTKLSNPYRREA